MSEKIDPTIWRETAYIAVWALLLTGVMHAVYLLIGLWALPVLFGSLLALVASVGNFFLMGLTVQKALRMTDEKAARQTVRLSQTGRLFLLLAVAVLGGVLPCFELFATVIPLLFPRVAILFRPLFKRMDAAPAGESGERGDPV